MTHNSTQCTWYQFGHKRFVTNLVDSTTVPHLNRALTFKSQTTTGPHFWTNNSPLSTLTRMMHDIQIIQTTLTVSLLTINNDYNAFHSSSKFKLHTSIQNIYLYSQDMIIQAKSHLTSATCNYKSLYNYTNILKNITIFIST